MDTCNWRPAQGASSSMEFGDYRAQPQRKRTVNKILDTLKKHLLFTEYERVQELKKIAERVEEEIYTSATSQSEYTRKICFMMLAMETRLQNPIQSNSADLYNSSVPLNLTENGGYWQEEVYQKIKDMKDLYLLEAGDWRAQLQADSRERIRNKIMGTLKRHLPFSGDEGLRELRKIAARFEEKIYAAATSESDYLRKISLKLLTMENRSQGPMQSNSSANSVNPSYPGGSQVMQQVNSQGQQLPITVSSNNIQQVMSQSMHNNIGSTGMQGSFSLLFASSPVNGLHQPTMASGAGPSSSLQNIPNMSSVQQNQLIGDTSMESDDWRDHLQADSRERIKNKILDTLKRHSPFFGHEELQELENMAVRFEEKIYIVATSQSDYLRKISLKMLTVETRSQNPMSNPMLSNSTVNSHNSSDPGSLVMQQVNTLGQQHPIPVPSNNIQQRMHTNIGSAGMQGSSSLSSAFPPGSGLQQPTMASVAGQSSNFQNIPNMSSVQQNQLISDTNMESDDWREQLQADSRERIKNKILDTLKRHLPYKGDEGLQELRKIAERFEEKIYAAAISQSDYLRKISLKMLTMETRPQYPMLSYSDGNSVNP